MDKFINLLHLYSSLWTIPLHAVNVKSNNWIERLMRAKKFIDRDEEEIFLERKKINKLCITMQEFKFLNLNSYLRLKKMFIKIRRTPTNLRKFYWKFNLSIIPDTEHDIMLEKEEFWQFNFEEKNDSRCLPW